MAVTIQKSNEVKAIDEATGVLDVNKYGGAIRYLSFAFAQAGAGDANSTVDLVLLPAGKVTVLLAQSRIANSAFGSSRVLDIGWPAYADANGTTVAADDNGLDDDQDVASAGAYAPTGTVGGAETRVFESRDGVRLQAKVAGGTIPDGATLAGYFAIVHQ